MSSNKTNADSNQPNPPPPPSTAEQQQQKTTTVMAVPDQETKDTLTKISRKTIDQGIYSDSQHVAALAVYTFIQPTSLLNNPHVIRPDQLIEAMMDISTRLYILMYSSPKLYNTISAGRDLINDLYRATNNKKSKLELIIKERDRFLHLFRNVYGERPALDNTYKEVSSAI